MPPKKGVAKSTTAKTVKAAVAKAVTGKCSSCKDCKTGAPLPAEDECADCGVSVCELCYDCCSGYEMCSKLGKAKFCKKCATGPATKIFKCQYSGLCEYWCMDCDEAEQAERGGGDYWD